MTRRMVQSLFVALGLLGVGASLTSAIPPAEQRAFADGLYARGLYDLALDEYLKLSRDPDPTVPMDLVLYRIGECHRRLGNPDAADRFYQRVLNEHPESEYAERAAFRRAEMRVVRGQVMEGLNLFRAFLVRDPDPALAAAAWYYRGYAARRLLQTAEAGEALRRVLDAYADSPFVAYAALELVELYRTQPEHATDVAAFLTLALERAPTPEVEAEVLFQKAEWWFAQNEHDLAANWYERLGEEHPDSPRAREGALQAAWAFHNAGRFADSAALAGRMINDVEEAERRVDWLYVQANAIRQLLRVDDASALYKELIEYFPEHPLARVATYELALMAFRQDRFEDAVQHVAGLDPDMEWEGDALWLMAESYAGMGRLDEAVQYYRLLLDRIQDDALAARALFRLGQVLQQRQDYAQAARTYRRLVDEFPAHELAPQALFASAFSWTLLERPEEAVADWDRLLRDYPDHELAVETKYQRALGWLEQGEWEKAKDALTAFVAAHADSPFAVDARFWLGTLYERAGDLPRAEAAFRAVLQAEPEAPLRDRARFRLAANLQRQDQSDEAADLWQALLDEGSAQEIRPSLLEWLANWRLGQGRFEAAQSIARRLAEQGDEAAWRQIGWALQGWAWLGLDDADQAVAAFVKSIEEPAQTREGARAALELGRLSMERGHVDVAQSHFEKAAAWATDDEDADVRARSLMGLGRLAEQAGDFARAARFFLSVGVLFDDPAITPEALYRATVALAETDRAMEREETARELKARYPNSEWAEKMREDER